MSFFLFVLLHIVQVTKIRGSPPPLQPPPKPPPFPPTPPPPPPSPSNKVKVSPPPSPSPSPFFDRADPSSLAVIGCDERADAQFDEFSKIAFPLSVPPPPCPPPPAPPPPPPPSPPPTPTPPSLLSVLVVPSEPSQLNDDNQSSDIQGNITPTPTPSLPLSNVVVPSQPSQLNDANQSPDIQGNTTLPPEIQAPAPPPPTPPSPLSVVVVSSEPSQKNDKNQSPEVQGNTTLTPKTKVPAPNVQSGDESIYDLYQHLIMEQNYEEQFVPEIIQPLQITPSQDDVDACRTFWRQQQPPQEYDGSQKTHCYPLSAVGRLQIFFKEINEIGTCTGAVIGAHTVLTAAHCFFLETTNVQFTPGQFGQYKPFGSFQNGIVYKSEKFNISNGQNDYAVVKFSEDIGALTGWLGVEYNGCDNLKGKKQYDLMVAGYANDRSDKMFTTDCDNTFVDFCDESGMFPHVCDTNLGTSGAALIDNNTIVGIHSKYRGDINKNIATYISQEIMDFIQNYYS